MRTRYTRNPTVQNILSEIRIQCSEAPFSETTETDRSRQTLLLAMQRSCYDTVKEHNARGKSKTLSLCFTIHTKQQNKHSYARIAEQVTEHGLRISATVHTSLL